MTNKIINDFNHLSKIHEKNEHRIKKLEKEHSKNNDTVHTQIKDLTIKELNQQLNELKKEIDVLRIGRNEAQKKCDQNRTERRKITIKNGEHMKRITELVTIENEYINIGTIQECIDYKNYYYNSLDYLSMNQVNNIVQNSEENSAEIEINYDQILEQLSETL